MTNFTELTQTMRRRDATWKQRLPDWLAITAACVFVFLAAYRIELPGLEFDEIIFVAPAQGDPDPSLFGIYLGSVPLLIFPYMGALKSWIYAPVFRLFGVSALTIRLPIILIAAVTLLIFYSAMRGKLGAVWAAVAVWIMAIDPANIFPNKLDYGPTALTHLFQAAILALWFCYRDKPKLWKVGLITICCVLGFFDRFNFIWLVAAFVVGISLCYPDSVKDLWVSSPKFVRWMTIIVGLIALSVAMYLILPLMHFPSAGSFTWHLRQSWNELQITLSGMAMALYTFGSSAGMIYRIPFWLIAADACLALACLLLPISNAEARENRKNGFFCLLIGFLIYVQILITPQAVGPHHHLMIFPLPILAFAFLARSLYDHFRTLKLSALVVVTAGAAAAAAISLSLVNVNNTMVYLSHFRNNLYYTSIWSPEIYSLSRYINEHGFESKRITCADCCVGPTLRTLAPKKLRRRIRDFWPVFKELPRNPEDQNTLLKNIFPEGKTFVVTFDASKGPFPETRRNFIALLSAHPELNSRLVKEFWYGGQRIYEVYEVVRLPGGA
jgi:hypothetical protein